MNPTEKQPFFYGWIIVATCFIAATSYGLFYTFGVFFKALQAEFGWGRALTGSVHSVHLVFYVFSTFAFGYLTDRIGQNGLCAWEPYLLGQVFVFAARSRASGSSTLFI